MSKDIRGRGTQILLVTGRPLWFSGYWIPECAHLHGWMDVCVSVWECATIEVDHVTIRHLCPFCLSWRRWNNSVTFRQIWTDWPDRAKLSGADLQTCLIDLRLPACVTRLQFAVGVILSQPTFGNWDARFFYVTSWSIFIIFVPLRKDCKTRRWGKQWCFGEPIIAGSISCSSFVCGIGCEEMRVNRRAAVRSLRSHDISVA